MKKPNLLDHGYKAVDRFTKILFWLLVIISIAFFALLIFCFVQNEQIKDLKCKQVRDYEAVQSYKNLLLTPNK